MRSEDERRLPWSEPKKVVQIRRWGRRVPESFQDMDVGEWKDRCVDDIKAVLGY